MAAVVVTDVIEETTDEAVVVVVTDVTDVTEDTVLTDVTEDTMLTVELVMVAIMDCPWEQDAVDECLSKAR